MYTIYMSGLHNPTLSGVNVCSRLPKALQLNDPKGLSFFLCVSTSCHYGGYKSGLSSGNSKIKRME